MITPAPAWLWTRTSDVISDYWLCQACDATGDGIRDVSGRAAAHVTRTGHTVTVVHAHTVTLEGVNASDGQPVL